MRFFRALFCVLTALTLAASTRAAQVLYAATAAGGTGELYTINPATGAGTLVGSLNDAGAVNYGMTGLVFDPISGLLFGSTANNVAATAAKLVSINPLTALVTVIGDFDAGNPDPKPATMTDLAFTPGGLLYGIGSIDGAHLYSINPLTGKATFIGDSDIPTTSGGGLAISAGGVFYGTPAPDNFGTYDSGSGLYTDIANPTKPVNGSYAALDFSDGGVLYGLNLGSAVTKPTHLVTIDPATGLVTDIADSVDRLDAIAFSTVVVPEPSTTAALVLTVTVGLFFKARRRK